MDIRDKWDIYQATYKRSNMIESMQEAVDSGVAELVEQYAAAGLTKRQILSRINDPTKKETRGRKIKQIENTKRDLFLSMQMGELSFVEASNISDVLTGVCRSFDCDENQKRSGLSPSKLKRVMTCGQFNVNSIKEMLGIGERQARRYMKGAEMVMGLVERNKG